MTSEPIKDSGRLEDSKEDTWGLFSVCKSVSFWLLVTVGTILLLREYLIYQNKGVVQVDNDLSHAANLRFEAIEKRLDALDGGVKEEEVTEEVMEEVAEEVTEEHTSPYSSRSRTKKE
jgi:hypothetical protein